MPTGQDVEGQGKAPQERTSASEIINTADLMTKHLVGPVILKHLNNLKLDIRAGRSEQAAKLHSVSTSSPTQINKQAVARNLPGGDFWAEQGEHGCWVAASDASPMAE